MQNFVAVNFLWYISDMKVSGIQANIFTPKTTGYVAAVGLGLSVWSGVAGNKALNKAHKPLAFLTVLATIFHIGLIEYYHYKFKDK